MPNLPLVERLLPREAGGDEDVDLDFSVAEADVSQMDDEFWNAYHALDRSQLFESTLAELRASNEPLTIGALALALPPTHDLETLAYWLAMAREAGIHVSDETESIDLLGERDGWTRFYAPHVELTHAEVRNLEAGKLE